ncbi:hypothetical protein ABZ958_03205 [Streptomyces sp. NPDC046237]|uniref:hypothetical protein n=1 Tax=Streptomyces sp. NPDC046237 TaxID=3154914 RepID=UPI00340AA319
MPVRLGRLQLELHRRAIHITREPNPHCPDCSGSRGGWIPIGGDVDWDECQCLDQLRTWRLPIWPPARHTSEEPF